MKNNSTNPESRRKGRWLEWLPKVGFGLNLFAFPLCMLPSAALGWSSRLVTVPFRGLALFLALVTIAIGLITGKATRSPFIWCAFLAFWVLYSVRIAIDCYLNPIMMEYSPDEFALLAIGVSMLPAMSYLAFETQEKGWAPVGMFGLLPLASFNIVAAFLYRNRFGADFQRITLGDDVDGAFGLNPLSLASAAGLAFVAGTALVITSWKWKWLGRIVGIGAMISALPVLLLGSSRSSFVSIGLCAIAMGIAKGRKNVRAAVVSVVVIALIAIGLLAVIEASGANIIERFAKTHVSYTYGDESNLRAEIWITCIDAFLKSPLVGVAVVPTIVNHPHNIIIDSFHAVGILGGVPLLILQALALIMAVKVLLHDGESIWLGAVFIFLFSEAMFHGNCFISNCYWGGIAVMLSLKIPAVLRSGASIQPPMASGLGSARAMWRR